MPLLQLDHVVGTRKFGLFKGSAAVGFYGATVAVAVGACTNLYIAGYKAGLWIDLGYSELELEPVR